MKVKVLKTGEINEGDLVSFGNDLAVYEAHDVQIENGEVTSFRVTLFSKPTE